MLPALRHQPALPSPICTCGEQVRWRPASPYCAASLPLPPTIQSVERFEKPSGREAPPSGVQGKRSEEHTSELQSLMRNSYAVFCLKKKKKPQSYTVFHLCL